MCQVVKLFVYDTVLELVAQPRVKCDKGSLDKKQMSSDS